MKINERDEETQAQLKRVTSHNENYFGLSCYQVSAVPLKEITGRFLDSH